MMLAILLVGCKKPPEESNSRGEFKVEKLFTHEGCSVYRFYDDRTVYYTNCNGETAYRQSCGKNCSRDDNVTTNVR